MANRTYIFEFTGEEVEILSSDGMVSLNDMAHVLVWSAKELSSTRAPERAVMEISSLAMDILSTLRGEDGQE